jgi:hypothetical protein
VRRLDFSTDRQHLEYYTNQMSISHQTQCIEPKPDHPLLAAPALYCQKSRTTCCSSHGHGELDPVYSMAVHSLSLQWVRCLDFSTNWEHLEYYTNQMSIRHNALKSPYNILLAINVNTHSCGIRTFFLCFFYTSDTYFILSIACIVNQLGQFLFLCQFLVTKITAHLH